MTDTNKEIILSIIVPVYNVEKYLRQCMESILDTESKLDKVEIILVDDGSTDSSPQICDEYNEKYSFIRVIHQKI